jgi:hypothetical protein
MRQIKQLTAVTLALALMTPGCASAGRTPVAAAPQPAVVDTASMADYVQRLPAGSKVRVERTDGTSLRGTLMKATGGTIVVQKDTRVPEPPVEVPVAQLARVTLNSGGTSTGKAVAIGIASGVGAFFAILAIAFATVDD